MKPRRKLCVLVVLVLLAALTQTAPAQATCPAGRCYAIADFQVYAPSGFHGADVTMRTNCTAFPAGSNGDFFVNDLWVSKGNQWIEAGMIADGPPSNGTHFFADDNLNHYHGGPAWSYNTYYHVLIALDGSGQYVLDVFDANDNYIWGVEMAQTWTGDPDLVQAGTESLNATHAYSSTSKMGYVTLQGVEHPGWNTSTLHADLIVDTGFFATWVNPDYWFRHGIGAAC